MIGRLAIISLACLVQGCAPQHYVTLQANTVNLYLQAPQATNVQFAASTDQYTLRKASKNQDGAWLVKGLTNKEFQYFYLVDGTLFIPDCRFKQNDDFGTTNCRYLP